MKMGWGSGRCEEKTTVKIDTNTVSFTKKDYLSMLWNLGTAYKAMEVEEDRLIQAWKDDDAARSEELKMASHDKIIRSLRSEWYTYRDAEQENANNAKKNWVVKLIECMFGKPTKTEVMVHYGCEAEYIDAKYPTGTDAYQELYKKVIGDTSNEQPWETLVRIVYFHITNRSRELVVSNAEVVDRVEMAPEAMFTVARKEYDLMTRTILRVNRGELSVQGPQLPSRGSYSDSDYHYLARISN